MTNEIKYKKKQFGKDGIKRGKTEREKQDF